MARNRSDDNVKRNRVCANVEDDIFVAVISLAEKRGTTVSELARSLIVTQLKSMDLLPETTIQRMAGVIN